MQKTEFGIDPLNWNVGLNFGNDWLAMVTVGPFYIILWHDGYGGK